MVQLHSDIYFDSKGRTPFFPIHYYKEDSEYGKHVQITPTCRNVRYTTPLRTIRGKRETRIMVGCTRTSAMTINLKRIQIKSKKELTNDD